MPVLARFLALLLLVVAVLATACGGGGELVEPTATPVASPTTAPTPSPTPSPSPTSEPEFPLTITDDRGREIVIEAQPRRIASLSAAHTEILFAIEAGGQVVAVDLTSNFPAEAQELSQLDAFTPNLETIAGVIPDLVLIFFDPGDLIASLERLDLTVIFLETPAEVEGVFRHIELLGEATGRSQEAERLVSNMRERIEGITDKLAEIQQGPRIFHELDPTLFTVGPGSFIDDVYGLLKAQNIAADTGQPFPQLSNEVVIAADPEVIILADEVPGETPDTVAARAGWRNISAVTSGRIYIVDPDIIGRPGPRIVEGLEVLASLLYAELFP